MAKITMQVEFSSVTEAAKFLAGAGQALPATVQIHSAPDPQHQPISVATSAPAAVQQQTSTATASGTSLAQAAVPSELDVKTAANAYLAKQGGRTPATFREIAKKYGAEVNGVIKPGNIPEANRQACIDELEKS